ALSAASRNLLSVLGVWPALEANAQAITSIEITDSGLNATLRPHLLGFEEELTPGVVAVLARWLRIDQRDAEAARRELGERQCERAPDEPAAGNYDVVGLSLHGEAMPRSA
ncbi:MAG: hypothetical protein ABW031_03985, partial [Methyloceanibacter sp.]